jgi:diguanylate cyclase (GGDEF)-like protein/PAS domain S-box-containing protein
VIQGVAKMDEKIDFHSLPLENENLHKERPIFTQTKNDLLTYKHQFQKFFEVKTEGLMASLQADIFDFEQADFPQYCDEPVLYSDKYLLRRAFEASLLTEVTPAAWLSLGDPQRRLHELQIHQIELEMQNETLHKARSEKEQAHRYTELFYFAPLGFFVMDHNSNISQANLWGASLLELERSYIIGRRFLTLLTQEHQVTFNNCLAKAFETSDKQSCEISVQVGKQALWFSLEANVGITKVDCLISMTGLTERKQADEALLKSNELFNKAEQVGNLGHWEWDEIASRYTTCTKQFANIFNITVQQMVENIISIEDARKFVCETDRERYIQVVTAARESKQVWDIGYRHVDKSGNWVYLHEIGEPVFDDQGTIIKILGTVQDITPYRLVVETLQEQNTLLGDLRDKFAQAERIINSIYWETDAQMKTVTHTSANTATIFGHQSESYIGDITSFENNIVLEDRLAIRKVFDALPSDPNPYEVEFRYQREDGRQVWVREVGKPMFDNTGKLAGFCGTQQDITAEKDKEFTLNQATEAALEANNALVFQQRALDEHAIVSITDLAGNITYANDRFCASSGYDREELLGYNHKVIKSDEHSDAVFADMWKTISSGHTWHGEMKNTNKIGMDYWVMTTIVPTLNDEGKPFQYVAIRTEITERKQVEEKLKRIAHYDLLTDLPNRVLLADRLSHAMVQCQRRMRSLAVAFLDLDGFKRINDTHGHHVGDELLIVVSQRMKKALRKGDTLARIGGDEFVVVMVDLENIEDSKPVLERLLKATADPVTLDNTVMQLSASIGVTFFPQDDVDADQLMRHADHAMYIAKHAGKNRYHLFDNEQDNAMKIQQEDIGDICLALARGEFILHYQPKVNMYTGEVIGVEALIRWQHPDRGLVLPFDFLPAIEGRAISLELGEWVIDTALSQINQWQSLGLQLPVSVNISTHQLQHGNFTARLAVLLAAHPEVQPHYLGLEILETSALSDISKVSATMNQCHDLGVSFALDDFGTGYSSLAYLKRLPAYLIKIDQSFIRDMLDDADDLAIVEAVVGLAKTFKREVIAEGVETIAHGAALLQLGCELAQGNGIARPMPASDIPQWVSSWKTDNVWQAKSVITRLHD